MGNAPFVLVEPASLLPHFLPYQATGWASCMKFINRELVRLLRVLIPRHSSVAFGPKSHIEVIRSLEPSQIIDINDLNPLDSSKPSHVVMMVWLDGVSDVYSELQRIHSSCSAETRIVVISVSRMWSRLSKKLSSSNESGRETNWIPPDEVQNFFEQAGFEKVSRRRALSIPVYIPLISRIANRWLSDLPILRHFSIFNVMTLRAIVNSQSMTPSVSVVVAARNEAGNIRNLVNRLPQLAPEQELIFVEGGSQDQTWDVIQGLTNDADATTRFPIRAFKQTGKGKGDAVRLGFEHAKGEILIILDADLSVPPEELPRFIEVLVSNRCEFANGSRLVYRMEREAMQFLNLLGNRFFGSAFTFLLGQPIRDTLCGTKALRASAYRQIAAERSFFGDFDPFGDFDLLFGASRIGLKIRDVPVHYKERVYGSTNISRFRHGFLLIRMTILAARRIKFI
jgi:Glycosyl transferase family 2